MPLPLNQSRDDLRRVYVSAWRKRLRGTPMEPLEAQVADIIEIHPEYQATLEDADDDVAQREYTPEGGESNPFLHMGLHLAVRDQVATDRPPGMRAAFEALARRAESPHDAEHQVIECLAVALWDAQRSGRAPDEQSYLESVRRLVR